jgi:hypothetical protein
VTVESPQFVRAQTSRNAVRKKSCGNSSSAALRRRRDFTLRAPGISSSANHPAAHPCTVNGFLDCPPRALTLRPYVSPRQDSWTEGKLLDCEVCAAQPCDSATNLIGISQTSQNCDVCHTPKKKIPYRDISRNLVAGSATALVREVAQRSTLAVLDEGFAAGSADVVPATPGRCSIPEWRISAQHHIPVFRGGLLDDPHRHGRYRNDLVIGSGHFCSSDSPPRREHSSRVTEAAL